MSNNDLLQGAPINRLLQGFLDFFQIKSFGQNPRSITPTVQPTFEMTDWYTDTQGQYISFAYTALAANANAAVLATGAAFQVPQDEVWQVNGMWAQALFSAAAVSTLAGLYPVMIHPSSNTSPIHLPITTPFPNVQNATTLVQTQYVATCTRKFLAPPGSQLTVAHGGFAFGASTCTIQLSALINRCRA